MFARAHFTDISNVSTKEAVGWITPDGSLLRYGRPPVNKWPNRYGEVLTDQGQS